MLTTIEKARAVYAIMEKRAAYQRREYVRDLLAQSMSKTAAPGVLTGPATNVAKSLSEQAPIYQAMPGNPVNSRFWTNLGSRMDRMNMQGAQKINSVIGAGARGFTALGDAYENIQNDLGTDLNNAYQAGKKGYAKARDWANGMWNKAKMLGNRTVANTARAVANAGKGAQYVQGAGRYLGDQIRNTVKGMNQAGIQNIQ